MISAASSAMRGAVVGSLLAVAACASPPAARAPRELAPAPVQPSPPRVSEAPPPPVASVRAGSLTVDLAPLASRALAKPWLRLAPPPGKRPPPTPRAMRVAEAVQADLRAGRAPTQLGALEALARATDAPPMVRAAYAAALTWLGRGDEAREAWRSLADDPGDVGGRARAQLVVADLAIGKVATGLAQGVPQAPELALATAYVAFASGDDAQLFYALGAALAGWRDATTLDALRADVAELAAASLLDLDTAVGAVGDAPTSDVPGAGTFLLVEHYHLAGRPADALAMAERGGLLVTDALEVADPRLAGASAPQRLVLVRAAVAAGRLALAARWVLAWLDVSPASAAKLLDEAELWHRTFDVTRDRRYAVAAGALYARLVTLPEPVATRARTLEGELDDSAAARPMRGLLPDALAQRWLAQLGRTATGCARQAAFAQHGMEINLGVVAVVTEGRVVLEVHAEPTFAGVAGCVRERGVQLALPDLGLHVTTRVYGMLRLRPVVSAGSARN